MLAQPGLAVAGCGLVAAKTSIISIRQPPQPYI